MTLLEWLAAELQEVGQRATALLISIGMHFPTLLVFPAAFLPPYVRVFPQYNDQKRRELRGLCERLARQGADGIVFVGEAWISIGPTDPPSLQRRQRQEVLVVAGACATGQRGQMYRILRDGNGTVRDVYEEPGSALHAWQSSLLSDLPWRKTPCPPEACRRGH